MLKSKVLAQFTEVLNANDPKSLKVQAFINEHRGDPELLELFDAAIKVQERLQRGELKLKPTDLEDAKKAAKALGKMEAKAAAR